MRTLTHDCTCDAPVHTERSHAHNNTKFSWGKFSWSEVKSRNSRKYCATKIWSYTVFVTGFAKIHHVASMCKLCNAKIVVSSPVFAIFRTFPLPTIAVTYGEGKCRIPKQNISRPLDLSSLYCCCLQSLLLRVLIGILLFTEPVAKGINGNSVQGLF